MRVRLQKLLAGAGIASRRHCERLVREARVTVNGQVATLGDSADPAVDRVAVDGETVRAEPLEYWVVHKPMGVVTTRDDPEGRPTVLGLVPAAAQRRRLFPVGRLDRDSEGLVLLTNDGDLAHRMLHPRWGSDKEYRVVVRGEVGTSTLRKFEEGVWLSDGRTAPAEISALRPDPKRNASVLRIVLREGRNRQIRRACAQLGHRVVQLTRLRVGPLALGALRPGDARAVKGEELQTLKEHVAGLEAAPGRGRGRLPRKSHGRKRPAERPRDPASERRKRRPGVLVEPSDTSRSV